MADLSSPITTTENDTPSNLLRQTVVEKKEQDIQEFMYKKSASQYDTAGKYEKYGIDLKPIAAEEEFDQRCAHLKSLGYEPSSLKDIAKVLGGKATPDRKWSGIVGKGTVINRGSYHDLTIKAIKHHTHKVYSNRSRVFSDTRGKIECLCNVNAAKAISAMHGPKAIVRSCDLSELRTPPPVSVLDKLDEVVDANLFDYVTCFANDESLKMSSRDCYLSIRDKAREEHRERVRQLKDPILVGVVISPSNKECLYYPILRWL